MNIKVYFYDGKTLLAKNEDNEFTVVTVSEEVIEDYKTYTIKYSHRIINGWESYFKESKVNRKELH